MPPKKHYIGRYNANAKRARERRKLETPEEREIRRKRDRERTAKYRASETVKQRERRLQIQRERTANYRALKKDRQRRAQLLDEKKRRASDQCEARQLLDRLEEFERPAAVFVKTEWECEVEGFQENEVTQDEKEEELESPTTVFLKSETVCDIEEAFQEENNEESWEEKAFLEEKASQDAEEEEVLEPPESVFLEPTTYAEEHSKAKEDPLAPSSGSEFLASIRQKIGALSARWRGHQENRELLENF